MSKTMGFAVYAPYNSTKPTHAHDILAHAEYIYKMPPRSDVEAIGLVKSVLINDVSLYLDYQPPLGRGRL